MIELAQFAKLALTVSIPLLVVGLGMRASFAEATLLFRHLLRAPYSLLRAIAAMNFIVPVFATAVAMAFNLPLAVKAALVAISISPVPPILPGKQLKFGGRDSYVYGLLVAISLVAVLFVPLTVELIGRLIDRDVHMSFGAIGILIAKTILVPLAAGIAIREFASRVADRLGPHLLRAGNIVLMLGLLPVLFASLRGIQALLGAGSVLAIFAVVSVAILTGHWMGGPDEHDRTALGIVCAMRHPGVALAIGAANFPEDRLIPAGVLLYALVAALATTVYGKVRFRRLTASKATLAAGA